MQKSSSQKTKLKALILNNKQTIKTMKPTLEQRLRRIEEKVSQKKRVTEKEISHDEEGFWRLDKKTIGNYVFPLSRQFKDFYESLNYGSDLDIDRLDYYIKQLQFIKKRAKFFKSEEEFVGTDFE